MQTISKVIITLLTLPILSCSGVNFSDWHFPYMMPVSGGNIISKKEFAQLKTGMTKEDVSYVVGYPLTPFLFTKNRWDFSYQSYKNNTLQKSYDVVILFDKNNKVKYINKSGDLFDQ